MQYWKTSNAETWNRFVMQHGVTSRPHKRIQPHVHHGYEHNEKDSPKRAGYNSQTVNCIPMSVHSGNISEVPFHFHRGKV